MNKVIRVSVLILSVATLGFAGQVGATAQQDPAAAQAQTESGVRSGLVIKKMDSTVSVWTKRGREVFQLNAATIMPQRPLIEGSLVVVRETTPGSLVAERIIIVDEEVWVEDKGVRERAIVGRFEPQMTSPNQMSIVTREGKQAFVIDPKTFHQPFPNANQRVALTYRVVPGKLPRFMATGLVILPDVFEDSPVKITYQDIPKPAAMPAPAPKPAAAPKPAPAPEPMVTLPQTGSQSPLVALFGLLMVAAGVVTRFWR